MKKFILSAMLVLVASAASAQPDRSTLAAEIFDQHRNLLGTDDSRRPILYYICDALNKIDGGNWGLLQKNDRGGFIPSDIIVWRPTLVTVDVISGATHPESPSWQVQGSFEGNPSWAWIPAPPVTVAPVPGPVVPTPGTPTPTPGFDGVPLPDPEVLRLLQQIIDQNERIFADETRRMQDLAAQLKAHDESPSWLKKVVGNHYVQLLGAGLLAKFGLPALGL